MKTKKLKFIKLKKITILEAFNSTVLSVSVIIACLTLIEISDTLKLEQTKNFYDINKDKEKVYNPIHSANEFINSKISNDSDKNWNIINHSKNIKKELDEIYYVIQKSTGEVLRFYSDAFLCVRSKMCNPVMAKIEICHLLPASYEMLGILKTNLERYGVRSSLYQDSINYNSEDRGLIAYHLDSLSSNLLDYREMCLQSEEGFSEIIYINRDKYTDFINNSTLVYKELEKSEELNKLTTNSKLALDHWLKSNPSYLDKEMVKEISNNSSVRINLYRMIYKSDPKLINSIIDYEYTFCYLKSNDFKINIRSIFSDEYNGLHCKNGILDVLSKMLKLEPIKNKENNFDFIKKNEFSEKYTIERKVLDELKLKRAKVLSEISFENVNSSEKLNTYNELEVKIENQQKINR